jgi:hypothetical protein
MAQPAVVDSRHRFVAFLPRQRTCLGALAVSWSEEYGASFLDGFHSRNYRARLACQSLIDHTASNEPPKRSFLLRFFLRYRIHPDV